MKRGIAAGATAGIVLGTADWIVNHVAVWLGEDGLARADRSPLVQTADFVSMFLDAGWAWAATAVLAGWLAARGTRVWRAAAAGFLALAFATVIDYGLSARLGGPSSGGLPGFWLIVSILFGPPLGLVGALIHRRGVAGTLAALAVPAGAALAMVLFPPMEPDNPMDAPVRIVVWLGATTATALILRNALRSCSLAVQVADSIGSSRYHWYQNNLLQWGQNKFLQTEVVQPGSNLSLRGPSTWPFLAVWMTIDARPVPASARRRGREGGSGPAAG